MQHSTFWGFLFLLLYDEGVFSFCVCFVFEGMAYGMVEAASSGMFGSMAFPFQDQNGGPGEKQTRLSTTSFPLTQYMM